MACPSLPSLLAFLLCAVPLVPAETFRNPSRIPLAKDPQSLAVLDLNGDGRPDLVVVTQVAPAIVPQRLLNVLLAQPDGSFLAIPPISPYSVEELLRRYCTFKVNVPDEDTPVVCAVAVTRTR